MSDWPLVRVEVLRDSGYGLEVLPGATPAEIATVAATLPPSAFVDHLRLSDSVMLLFRRFPARVPDPSAPVDAPTTPASAAAGWVPA